MENAIEFIFQILILIFSVVMHEISHGYAALALGDETAKREGRLTLNPLRHLDPFGSIILPSVSYLLGGFIFGWAKPVPYNPYNLKNQKWGPALVGIAGPCANMLLGVLFGFLLRIVPMLTLYGAPGAFVYNLSVIISMIAFLNIVLALFNLVPVPPLDGSKILFALLPYQWRNAQNFLEQYGFILLLMFVFFLSGLLLHPAFFIFRLVSGSAPLF